MHRFRLRRSLAIALTVVLWAMIWSAIWVALFEAGHQFMAKPPIYEERIRSLHGRVAAFLSAHGIQSTHDSVKSLYDYDRIVELALEEILRAAGNPVEGVEHHQAYALTIEPKTPDATSWF
jgi:uncharacterized protein YneF (UPF0154 family)